MLTRSHCVFDDYVNSNTTVYTSLEHTGFLSRADQLVIHAFVYLGSTLTPGSLTVTIEHSGDGRNWKQKNAAAEINGGALTASQKTILWGGERSPTRPSLRFVRLAISQSSSISARVELHVTARTRSRVGHEPCHEPPERQVLPLSPNHSLPLPISTRTAAELQRLASDWGHLPPDERLEQIRANVSTEAVRDLHLVTQHLRALPREKKLEAITNARESERLLTLPEEERERALAGVRSMQQLLSHLSSEEPNAGSAVKASSQSA